MEGGVHRPGLQCDRIRFGTIGTVHSGNICYILIPF